MCKSDSVAERQILGLQADLYAAMSKVQGSRVDSVPFRHSCDEPVPKAEVAAQAFVPLPADVPLTIVHLP